MDKALEEVFANAVGVELDEELAAQFPVKEQYEVFVPNGLGDENTRVCMYEPLNRRSVTPIIINGHGGGFVKGYRGRDIVFSRNLAFHTGCLVADIDYKTAPEKKYPYALNEMYAVIKYFSDHHEKYRIDPKRIIVSGCSAGGTLAVGAALMAKERKEFSIAQLILAYPPLDLATDPADKPLIVALEGEKRVEISRNYNNWYIDPERRREIYSSPSCATVEQLEGLPPTLIVFGGKDGLSAEAAKFAADLVQANVLVTARRFPEAGHGFLVRRNGGFEAAERIIFDTCAYYYNKMENEA